MLRFIHVLRKRSPFSCLQKRPGQASEREDAETSRKSRPLPLASQEAGTRSGGGAGGRGQGRALAQGARRLVSVSTLCVCPALPSPPPAPPASPSWPRWRRLARPVSGPPTASCPLSCPGPARPPRPRPPVLTPPLTAFRFWFPNCKRLRDIVAASSSVRPGHAGNARPATPCADSPGPSAVPGPA